MLCFRQRERRRIHRRSDRARCLFWVRSSHPSSKCLNGSFRPEVVAQTLPKPAAWSMKSRQIVAALFTLVGMLGAELLPDRCFEDPFRSGWETRDGYELPRNRHRRKGCDDLGTCHAKPTNFTSVASAKYLQVPDPLHAIGRYFALWIDLERASPPPHPFPILSRIN